MYIIKLDYCEKLENLNVDAEGYPKQKVIEEYKSGKRKAHETTVKYFATLLREPNWKDLVE